MSNNPFEKFGNMFSGNQDYGHLVDNFEEGEGIPPVTKKQKGYICGLCNNMGLDPHFDLPGGVPNVDDLDLKQASEVIEVLKSDYEYFGGRGI